MACLEKQSRPRAKPDLNQELVLIRSRQWLVPGHWRGKIWAYLLAGFPCVAGHPAQSCPWVDPLDCTLLPGSLKDQEENLIVVKTWTGGEKKRRHTRQWANIPALTQTHYKTLWYIDESKTYKEILQSQSSTHLHMFARKGQTKQTLQESESRKHLNALQQKKIR